MTCIVCGKPQVAGLAGWHATCPACHYESAALTPAINAHTGPAVDEAEREAGLKALRLENFRTIVAYAKRYVAASRPRLLDVGSAMVGSWRRRAKSSTCSASSPTRWSAAAPQRVACRFGRATSRMC